MKIARLGHRPGSGAPPAARSRARPARRRECGARAPRAACRSDARRRSRARRTRRRQAAIEVGFGQEMVGDAVLLAGPRRARRRRHRQPELGVALAQRRDQRALADPGGPGDHEYLGQPGAATTAGSVPACRRRSAVQHRDQLGTLALGEPADRLARRDPAVRENLVDLHATVLRHREQHVEDLRGLEVLRGSSSSCWIEWRPALRSRFSCARCERISFARARASIRWLNERSGVAGSFMERRLTGRHGRRVYRLGGPMQALRGNSSQPRLEV